MVEGCSCGASIRTWRYGAVLRWRFEHAHEIEVEVPQLQVPPTGGTSHIERASEGYYSDYEDKRMGFTPNE